MNKEDCRVGMVVYDRHGGVKCIVIKCNPKNAQVRLVEELKAGGRGSKPGSLWNIPYRILDPVVSENMGTEMVMRSFEQPDNDGIKTYFKNKQIEEKIPLNFPEGSPEWHILKAICELWRRLDDDSLEKEADAVLGGRRAQTVRLLRAHYSGLINRMFTAIGREVEKDEALAWESGNNTEQQVPIQEEIK